MISGISTLPFFSLLAIGVDQAFLVSLYGPLYSIIILSFSEEFFKSIALWWDKELKKQYYYPIIIGLSFAFFENISYLFGYEFTISFITLATIRLFTGSTAHAIFTTLVAHIMNKGSKGTKTLYYILGLFVAGSFHSFFNLLHHWEMSYLTIPLLVILIIYIHFDGEEKQTATTPRTTTRVPHLHPIASQ